MNVGLPAPDDARTQDVLAWAFDRFGERIALVTAFQAEGIVLLDMAHQVNPDVHVITVDTGRLPQETHDLIERVRARYGITVDVRVPDASLVERMVARHGVNLFRADPSLRRVCCEVRKVFPLDRALDGLDAWITGVRRGQSNARAQTRVIERDAARDNVVKIAPLASWDRAQVWEYIAERDLPYHALYDDGYASIGCAPCTRAIGHDEPERAGRWWWELEGRKECGIHERTPDEGVREELAWLTN